MCFQKKKNQLCDKYLQLTLLLENPLPRIYMANKISSTLYVVHTFVHCILHRYLFYCKVFTKGISSEICTHSIRIYFSDCIVHCTHWNVDYLIFEMVYLECDDEYDEEQDKSDVHCGWFFCLPEKGLIRGLGRRMQIDYQRPIHPKYTLGKYKTHWKPPENHPKPTKKPRPKKVSLRTLEKNTHRLPATYTPKIWT